MDSCNSGSLQSSSNGEEEYDSRPESISAFFNSPLAHHHHPPPQLPSTSHHQPSSSFFFDPLPTYFDAFPRSPPPPDPNPFLPTTSAWPPTTRPPRPSDPTCTDANLIPAPPPPMAAADLRPYTGAAGSSAQRISKKRSRMSRRAPTTVLTTDTSNFRAMVQEFTGIPTPPFSSSSLPFSRPRLELLQTTALPPYLLRPFAHKAQQLQPQPQPLSLGSMPSTSMLGALPSTINARRCTDANTSMNASAAAAAAATATTTTGITTNDIGLGLNQHQELLNMGSPMFALQSLLQPPLTPTMPAFGERPQTPAEINLMDYGIGNLGHAVSSERDGDRAQSRPGIANSVTVRGEGLMDTWIIPSD